MDKILRLNQDVVNLKADLRTRYNPLLSPKFRLGSLWVLREQRAYHKDADPYLVISPYGTSRWISWDPASLEEYGLYPWHFNEVPVETWQDIANINGGFTHAAGDVINILIRREVVTIDEVQSALDKWLNTEDAEIA